VPVVAAEIYNTLYYISKRSELRTKAIVMNDTVTTLTSLTTVYFIDVKTF